MPIALEYRDPSDLWTISNIVGQYLSSFGKWKTEAKLSFGPSMLSDDGDAIASHCHDWINGQLAEMQEGWSNVHFDS